MNYSIQRCFKPPGLIQRALTYYVELNENGLYLICLGKATVQPVAQDPLSQVIANGAVKFFDKRYEKEILKNEAELKTHGTESMLKNKNCFFIPSDKIQSFKVKVLPNRFLQIKLKGTIHRTFICDPVFGRIASQMEQMLGKNK